MKIWIDLLNPSDVFFFSALGRELCQEHNIFVTARERSETVSLAEESQMTPRVIGRDFSNRIIKTINHAVRTVELFLKVPRFDVAFGFGDTQSIAVSKMRSKSSVVFYDNDLLFLQRTLAGSLDTKLMTKADYIVVPSAFPLQALTKEGAQKKFVYQFDGYKEDVYVADYKPASDFVDKLPFRKFVVVRPEALFAAYVRETKSMVRSLLEALVREGIDVVYLPRISQDLDHAQGIGDTHIFIPNRALNGLDLCWYADAVLTGSGTLAREAACLGTAAVSFFPERLLAVDQALVSEGRVFHSRNLNEIMNYLASKCGNNVEKKLNQERSRRVKQKVLDIISEILLNIQE